MTYFNWVIFSQLHSWASHWPPPSLTPPLFRNAPQLDMLQKRQENANVTIFAWIGKFRWICIFCVFGWICQILRFKGELPNLRIFSGTDDATAENTANAETADNKNTDKNRERRTDRQKKITATNETPRNQQQSPMHRQPIPKQPKTHNKIPPQRSKKRTPKRPKTPYT